MMFVKGCEYFCTAVYVVHETEDKQDFRTVAKAVQATDHKKKEMKVKEFPCTVCRNEPVTLIKLVMNMLSKCLNV